MTHLPVTLTEQLDTLRSLIDWPLGRFSSMFWLDEYPRWKGCLRQGDDGHAGHGHPAQPGRRRRAVRRREELVRNNGLPAEVLIEVGGDHRLADPASLETMLMACERLTPAHE